MDKDRTFKSFDIHKNQMLILTEDAIFNKQKTLSVFGGEPLTLGE